MILDLVGKSMLVRLQENLLRIAVDINLNPNIVASIYYNVLQYVGMPPTFVISSSMVTD